jgi:uncharacterized protein (DUF983 family)
MDDVVLSWSFQNWITVLLMVAVFFVVVVLLTKTAKALIAGQQSAAS